MATSHWYPTAEICPSPHHDLRPVPGDVSLLVIHNISLPPGQFGGNYISQFFCGQLDTTHHPYFAQIADLRVSAHCLIKRQGHIIQYVAFDKRAWHAGKSSFQGRGVCNDYSIGIELEGTDTMPYTDIQYQRLAELTEFLLQHYPQISLARIVGHNDIAPGRKTDPGEAFMWGQFRLHLQQQLANPTHPTHHTPTRGETQL